MTQRPFLLQLPIHYPPRFRPVPETMTKLQTSPAIHGTFENGGGVRSQMTQAGAERKYESERRVQLESRKNISYLDIDANENTKKQFGEDPWAHEYAHDFRARAMKEHLHQTKVLIIGAGYGGLLFAVRLIQTGVFTAEDILMVDDAAGFGGTWYWNRYPGVACDVESYVYMPLLEETGYMPQRKYASGTELRMYAELIAHTWGLQERVLFRSRLQSLDWDDVENHWKASGLCFHKEPRQQDIPISLTARFVILAGGIFSSPKIPGFANIMDYRGDMFHVSRWNYQCTGGSQQDPGLSKLRNKKVGIIGTGASAVQAIPFLAEHSESLVVFQRTPSAVDQRSNMQTDPIWWKKMILSKGTGWQKERMENFNAFTCYHYPQPEVNMVDDQWTKMPSFSVLVGSVQNRSPDYLDQIKRLDFARQERIRASIRDTVQDWDTAEALAPWYPGWCKRPCFHDNYLSTFNRRNVTLIDVRQQPISHFLKNGVVVNATEHDLDVVIFSTGYHTAQSNPGERANISVTGRNSRKMSEKWADGLATLHGTMTREFPNLFFPGPNQAGVSANQTYVLDQLSTHVAYILAETARNARGESDRAPQLVIEPTSEAEEAWAMQVLSRIPPYPLTQCTPGFYNQEGATGRLRNADLKEKMKAARLATWGEGVASYIQQVERWRVEGNLHGLEVREV